MWSVGATRNYLGTQTYPGFEGMSGDDLWDKIEGQLRQLSTYAVHSAQVNPPPPPPPPPEPIDL